MSGQPETLNPRKAPDPAPASRFARDIGRSASALRGLYAALGTPSMYDNQAEGGGPDYMSLLDALSVTAEYLEFLANEMANDGGARPLASRE